MIYALYFLITLFVFSPGFPGEVKWSPIPLAYIVPIGLAYWYVRRVEKRGFWASVGIKKDGFFNGFLWIFAITPPFVVAVGLSSIWAETLIVTSPLPSQIWSPPVWWYLFMVVGAFIPVGLCEETIFRGFLLDRFLVKGSLFAIIVSSALFSLAHTQNIWLIAYGDYSGFFGFIGAFTAALWMGIAYFKSRNLIWPIIMHGFGDLVMYPLAHFFGPEVIGPIWMFPIVIGVLCIVFLCYKWLKQRHQKIEKDAA